MNPDQSSRRRVKGWKNIIDFDFNGCENPQGRMKLNTHSREKRLMTMEGKGMIQGERERKKEGIKESLICSPVKAKKTDESCLKTIPHNLLTNQPALTVG